MMTQAIKGKTRAEAEELFERFHALVTGQGAGKGAGAAGGLSTTPDPALGRLKVFEGVARFRANYLRQECWNERTNSYDPGYYRDENGRLYRGDSTANGTLLGAVIGGALGNQVGKGDGRTAATIAGAVIGGKIGHDVDANHNSGYADNNPYEYRDNSGIVRRCRTVSDGGRFGGYDVTYRYAGQSYHALMNYRPGRTIRVMVDVRPMFEGVASRY